MNSTLSRKRKQPALAPPSGSQDLNFNNTCFMEIDCEAIAKANNWELPKASKYPKIDNSDGPTSSASSTFPRISHASSGKPTIVPFTTKQMAKNEMPLLEEEDVNSIDMNNTCFLDIDCEAIAKQNNFEYPSTSNVQKVEVPSSSKKTISIYNRPPVPLWSAEEEKPEDAKENENIAEILTQALIEKSENKKDFVLTQNTSCVNSFKRNSDAVEVVENKETSSIIVHRKNATLTRDSPKRARTSAKDFYGLPKDVKQFLLQTKNIEDLYDWQYECLSLPAFSNNRNVIYSLPTSGGKSLVAEVLILREIIIERKNVILLLPFVSIVQEKIQDLLPFAMQYKFLVEEYCAGKGTIPPTKRREKNSIFIATTEKCQMLIDSLIETKRLNEIGLIVIDELHMIGDKSRGHNLELLLTKIMYLNSLKKCSIQIVGMSATIENMNEISQFLDAEVYTRNFRPVELKEFIKMEDNLISVNYKAKSIKDTFLIERTNIGGDYDSRQRARDPDHISALVHESIRIKSSCLIFCASKKSCENVALLLIDTLPSCITKTSKSQRINLIESIKEDSNGKICPTLLKLIPYGIAYHHSGLTSSERRRVEDAYRQGILNVICCTSTLAAGVNLPAGRVIIRHPHIGKDFIPLATYKQMVGRAGRAGKSSIGESILICNRKNYEQVISLLTSRMEFTISGFLNDISHLSMMLLNLMKIKLVHSYDDIDDFIRHSLAYVQASDDDGDSLFEDLKETIKNLLNERAISHKFRSNGTRLVAIEYVDGSGHEVHIYPDDELKISQVGEAAINSGKSLQEAKELESDLRKAHESLVLTQSLHLLYIIAPKEVYLSLNVESRTFSENFLGMLTKNPSVEQTAKVIGISMAQITRMMTTSSLTEAKIAIMKRFYVAMVLFELWNGGDTFEVAMRYKIDRGVVSKVMSSASSEAYSVFKFCEIFEEFWVFKEILENFSKRLQHCCSLELLPLMDLPGIKIGRAKMMYTAGIKSLMDVAALTPEELMSTIKFINPTQAKRVIDAARFTLRNEFDDNCEKLVAIKDVLKKNA